MVEAKVWVSEENGLGLGWTVRLGLCLPPSECNEGDGDEEIQVWWYLLLAQLNNAGTNGARGGGFGWRLGWM